MLPDVYFFNPTCEYAISNGTVSWQPNRLLQKMESELSVLQLFFSKPGDFILVREMPSENFINSLKQIGLSSLLIVPVKKAFSDKKFITLPKNKLLPWGWSPATHHFLKPLKESCSEEFKNSINFIWHKQDKELYSKKIASKISKNILTNLNSEYLVPLDQLSKVCYTIEDVISLIPQWGNLMVKAPWSTSGRGLQAITQTPIHKAIRNRISGLIKEQGFVMVEPLWDKHFDMAFIFKSQKGRISFLGMSYFQTDSKGQYKGNHLNGIPKETDSHLSDFIELSKKQLLPKIKESLIKEDFHKRYEGFFGVDILIFKNKQEKLRIHPCLEINLRYSMGLLALQLEKFIIPGKKGEFRIYHNPKHSFMDFSKTKREEYPLHIENNKIASGFFALTDSFTETSFGAYVIIN